MHFLFLFCVGCGGGGRCLYSGFLFNIHFCVLSCDLIDFLSIPSFPQNWQSVLGIAVDSDDTDVGITVEDDVNNVGFTVEEDVTKFGVDDEDVITVVAVEFSAIEVSIDIEDVADVFNVAAELDATKLDVAVDFIL